MKKYNSFLLCCISMLFVLACGKKDDNTVQLDKAMLIGSWKFSQSLIFHKPGDTIAWADPPLEGCAALQTWAFETDGKHRFVSYKQSGSDCVVRTSRIGSYTFDENTKELAITYPNETEIFKIFKINDTEMWWNIGPIRLEENTTDYLHILVFKK